MVLCRKSFFRTQNNRFLNHCSFPRSQDSKEVQHCQQVTGEGAGQTEVLAAKALKGKTSSGLQEEEVGSRGELWP